MEPHEKLRFTPVDHPDARVQRVGFDLTDPYVEHCWSGAVGPSATLLLRRLPALWVEQVPADINASELSRSLGLGASVTSRSRFANVLRRVVRFDLARPAKNGAGLDVYRQVPPLSRAQLGRMPSWTQDTHERLLGAHLEGLDDQSRHRANGTTIAPSLQRSHHTASRAANAPGRGLGL